MGCADEMRAFFDELAPEWGNEPEKYALREKLTGLMELPSGGRIADVGCGKGVMLPHLLRREPSCIYAVDLSGEMIRQARSLFRDGRITFLNGDFLTAPLPKLDAAVLFNVYPHFTDKGALAARLASVIRSGGLAVIAHGAGKDRINGVHCGRRVRRLSSPLRDAASEAEVFRPFFTPSRFEDNDSFYLIRMVRGEDC